MTNDRNLNLNYCRDDKRHGRFTCLYQRFLLRSKLFLKLGRTVLLQAIFLKDSVLICFTFLR